MNQDAEDGYYTPRESVHGPALKPTRPMRRSLCRRSPACAVQPDSRASGSRSGASARNGTFAASSRFQGSFQPPCTPLMDALSRLLAGLASASCCGVRLAKEGLRRRPRKPSFDVCTVHSETTLRLLPCP